MYWRVIAERDYNRNQKLRTMEKKGNKRIRNILFGKIGMNTGAC